MPAFQSSARKTCPGDRSIPRRKSAAAQAAWRGPGGSRLEATPDAAFAQRREEQRRRDVEGEGQHGSVGEDPLQRYVGRGADVGGQTDHADHHQRVLACGECRQECGNGETDEHAVVNEYAARTLR